MAGVGAKRSPTTPCARPRRRPSTACGPPDPHGFLRTSGHDVGLPAGQMGNSEVGHLNIGAGRVVMQDLPRIGEAIASGEIAQAPALVDLIGKLEAKRRHLPSVWPGVGRRRAFAPGAWRGTRPAGGQLRGFRSRCTSSPTAATPGRRTPQRDGFVHDFVTALPPSDGSSHE